MVTGWVFFFIWNAPSSWERGRDKTTIIEDKCGTRLAKRASLLPSSKKEKGESPIIAVD